MTIYAVREGRKPGLYSTWPECEAQVKGFSGAEYKKFTSKAQAEAYLAQSLGANAETRDLAIYIDGSYNKNTGHYGYGGLILKPDGQKETFFGQGSTDVRKMRNVAGELAAAMRAVAYAKKEGYAVFNLYYDYEGIEKWVTGEWRAKNQWTQQYQAFMQSHLPVLKINFIKVKAHSNHRYNDEADQLAKRGAGIEV